MRKPLKRPKIDPDVALIAGILDAQMQALSRGGLTWLSKKLGLSVSAMRKRSLSKGFGLDAASIRAVLLILSTKADKFTTPPIKTVQTSKYVIDLHQTKNGVTPAWRQK